MRQFVPIVAVALVLGLGFIASVAHGGPPIVTASVERGSIRVDWRSRGPRPGIDSGCEQLARAFLVSVYDDDDDWLFSQEFFNGTRGNGTVLVGDSRLSGKSGLKVRAWTRHSCNSWNVYSEASRFIENLDIAEDNRVSGFSIQVTRNRTGEEMHLLSTPGMPNTAVFGFNESNPAVYVKILNHCAEADKRHHALDVASTTGEELTVRVWHPRTEYDYQARTYRVGGVNRILTDRISGRPCEK